MVLILIEQCHEPTLSYQCTHRLSDEALGAVLGGTFDMSAVGRIPHSFLFSSIQELLAAK